MNSTYLKTGAFIMMIAVTLGAMGAHYFETKISADALSTYETGIRYMIYHALAILAVGFAFEKFNQKKLKIAFVLFVIGILLFSGSVLLLSLKSYLGIESFAAVLGPITPFGGLAFISGWLFFALALSVPSDK